MDRWHDIKTEYITTEISTRAIAKKYGISYSILSKRSAREHWEAARKQYLVKLEAKKLEAHTKIEVDEYKSLLRAASTLSEKLCSIVESVDAEDLTVGGMRDLRSLTMAIKDLAEIQGIKPDADKREQEARIKSLERQSEVVEPEPVKVVICGAEDFCEK